jgi:23S rRNA pseudouridine2605 synthase
MEPPRLEKPERLQKVMARAGLGSRRACEKLILQGRVRVNNQVVTELGTRVDAMRDDIVVDGQPIETPPSLVYLILHKPSGYLSTTHDPHGRPTVMELLSVSQRVYPVGRLDLESEGLLLFTNDGPLTQRLTHPRFQHEREYRVLVQGQPGRLALRALRQGIELEDGKTSPAEARLIQGESAPKGTSWLRMTLREGRKRQIRRMCAAAGHPVQRLIRVRMGPLRLGDLEPGASRRLTRQEIKSLKTGTGLQPQRQSRRSRRK